MSLHNMMLPHGPDAAAFEHASTVELKPHKIANTLAFMFESRFPQKLTRYSSELTSRDDGYVDCWSDLKRRFAR
jgi:homogentisate 1,2-dioxygenase